MAKKKNSGTKRTTQKYEDFLRALQLVGLGLSSCTAKLDRDEYFSSMRKKDLVRKIETEFDLMDAGDDFFEPIATFRLTAPEDEEAKPALSIECSFSAHFHVAGGVVDREFAERFCKSEFRVVMWPYFRQFVADLSARMAIPPVMVPFATPAELKK